MKRILILSDHSFMLWKFRKELIQTLLASGMEVTVGVPLGAHIQDIKNLGCELIDTPWTVEAPIPSGSWHCCADTTGC